MSGYGNALLLDNSVWARLIDGRLADAERETFEDALAAGELDLPAIASRDALQRA